MLQYVVLRDGRGMWSLIQCDKAVGDEPSVVFKRQGSERAVVLGKPVRCLPSNATSLAVKILAWGSARLELVPPSSAGPAQGCLWHLRELSGSSAATGRWCWGGGATAAKRETASPPGTEG